MDPKAFRSSSSAFILLIKHQTDKQIDRFSGFFTSGNPGFVLFHREQSDFFGVFLVCVGVGIPFLLQLPQFDLDLHQVSATKAELPLLFIVLWGSAG